MPKLNLVKYYGGQSYNNIFIHGHYPKGWQNKIVVECYGGGYSTTLQHKPASIEIYNDKDFSIYNIFRCLQKDSDCFTKHIQNYEYNEENFKVALDECEKYRELPFTNYELELDYAINNLILRRFSRGGLMKNYAASNRVRRGNPNGDAGSFDHFKTVTLPKVAARIEYVIFENRAAIDVINEYDSKDTFFMLDPIWLPEHRVAKKAYGEFEMSVDQHIELLDTIVDCKSSVIILGYPSLLYDGMLKERRGWHRFDKQATSHAGQVAKKVKKTISLWRNFV